MQKRMSVLVVILLASSMLWMITSQSTEGAESGDFPNNYNMQDYEPSAEDQWDLDVTQSRDGSYFAVWADDRAEIIDIRFSKSQNGTSWGDGQFNNNDKIVNSDSGEGLDHWAPAIAVDDQPRLYCIWLDNGGDGIRMMMSTSNNSGNFWTPARQITQVTGQVSEPEMVWSPTAGLVIVYVLEHQRTPESVLERDIMFIRSTNEGETFTSPMILNDDDSQEDQVHPSVSVSSTGRIAVAWEDYRNGDSVSGYNSDIYMAYTTTGLSFTEDIRVGRPGDIVKQQYPDIAFSKRGDIMVVWQESTLNGWRVKYSPGWAASQGWDRNMSDEYPATSENLTTEDQFRPKTDYIDGAFSIAWVEVDIRNFYLVRCGYLTREGDFLSGNRIVDNSIDLGTFINDPEIYKSEMYRQTVSVEGIGSKTQVFWIDHRTDNNPSNDINEDPDPYTATAFEDPSIPKPPIAVQATTSGVTWDEATISWEVSPDIDFQGYYLTIEEGTDPPYPDKNLNNGSVTNRLGTSFTFRNLKPETQYSVRLLTLDRYGNRADSNVVQFFTGSNSLPSFRFVEPDGINDEADEGFTISWECSDPEETAEFVIHYDTDLDPAGQEFLVSGTSADGFGEYFWNTSSLRPGGYTLNATISDGVNQPVTVYSPAIIVTHRTVVKDHPRVLSVRAEGGVGSAFADPVVTITFSKPVSAVSLDSESMVVLGPENLRIAGSISMENDTVALWRPADLLEFGTQYTLVLKPDITDLFGNKLDGANIGQPSSYEFTFITRSDNKPPIIRKWSPQGSGTSLRPEIMVVFDIPVASSTLTEENIKLTRGTGREIPIEIELSGSGLEIEITANEPLLPNTTYSLTMGDGITSQKGQRLLSTFMWNFTTGRPDMSKDTDGDSVPDDLDWFPEDPSEWSDTDRDGIGDNKDLDDDGDGMSDEWELEHDLDPKDPTDAEEDPDGDGKNNLEEYIDRSDPRSEKHEGNDSLFYFIVIMAVGMVIILALVIYAVVLRKNIREKDEQRNFFREE